MDAKKAREITNKANNSNIDGHLQQIFSNIERVANTGLCSYTYHFDLVSPDDAYGVKERLVQMGYTTELDFSDGEYHLTIGW